MITYVKGDATCPLGAGVKIIAHIVNDRGGWGRGFVVAISKRWKKPEEAYRRWVWEKNFILGEVQFVPVGKYLYIGNMLCQHGLIGRSNPVPLRYDALETCLKKVVQTAERLKASVHMPIGIGSGLAGGNSNKILEIIEKNLCEKGVRVTMYEYKK